MIPSYSLRKTISFSFIFFLSIVLSLSINKYQYALDGAFVISGLVEYPSLSPMNYYYYNSWTFLHQISAFLLKLGLSGDEISNLLLILSTLCFGMGTFLIANSIINNYFLAVLITSSALILGKNFGDTDYPSLIFSEHSFGMFGFATSTLIIGLISNNKLFLSSLFTAFLICIHPVIGVWMMFFYLLSIFLQQKYILVRNDLLYGLILGCFISAISFYFFFISKFPINDYDSSLYEIFIKNWDGHRNTESEIHYTYILKSLILLSVLVYYKKFFSKKISPGLDLAIYFFIILIIAGLLFYLSYKLFPFFFPEILIKALPSRFLMIYSFLGWPVIISMTYIFFLKIFLSKKKLITTFFYILLIFPVIQKEERVINTLKYFYFTEKKEKNVFFEKLKNIETENHILSTTSLNYSILRQANKPFLFDTNSFDFLPYHPYLINDVDLIFKEIYDIDLRVKPKIKNSYVSDNYIKTIFQKKELNEWKIIFDNHKIDYLVVPSDWVINLSLVLKNNGISLYKI